MLQIGAPPRRFDSAALRNRIREQSRHRLGIDDPILREVKAIHQKEGRSMGAVASELLAEALARRRPSARASFHWTARPMKARVALSDTDAIEAALDADRPCAARSM